MVTDAKLPLKMFEFLRVSPDWNFEIMTISLPIKLPCTLPLCPKKYENRSSSKQFT